MEEERRSLREANLAATNGTGRPTAAFMKTLDSSVKKNSAVIKKLKQISDDQKDSLLTDLNQVNLSKYISEVVVALAEAKYKMTSKDIYAAVKICSHLHQRYPDFTPLLIPALTKFFTPTKPIPNESEVDKTARLQRKRVLFRLLGELLLYGIFSDVSALSHILHDLIATDQTKDKENAFGNLSLIVSWARTVGDEIIGLKKKIEPSDQVLTANQRQDFVNQLDRYFDSASHFLYNEHKELRAKEKENHHILETKGELSEQNAAAYDKLRKSYDNLIRNLTLFGEVIGKNLPDLPEDSNTTRIEAATVSAQSTSKESNATDSFFDDEDTRSFYENLSDLKASVPGVLLGETDPKSDSTKETTSEMKDDKTKKDKDDKDKESEKESSSASGGSNLDALLARLPTCVNRDLIDQASVEFCYSNSKTNRKKLVKALFNVPRTQLALLPYYARMVATLNQYMKDVGPMLVSMLEEEFHSLYKGKDQINIETKIKNIRFLGELAKFKICTSNQVLGYLKLCLDDFVHHNIDITCNLLETCGRFLYKLPETHVRTKNLLEMMMRLKNVQNLPPRLDTMVENAFYQCVPPERQAKKRKDEPALHQYIRKLIYLDLNKNTVKYALKQLRKIPWDSQNELFLLNCLLKVHKGKYNNIHLVASLISALASYHELMGIMLVDSLLEAIRLNMEENNFNNQQKQVMNVKFLGELYNYCMVESQLIFDTLYNLLTFGHSDTQEPSTLDPPGDCFRIRLVCTLLDTCGQYFDRGSSKKRLDKFLVYFQRYILSKTKIPMDVEFMISDTFEALRPNLVRIPTHAQACEEVAKIEQEEKLLAQAQTLHPVSGGSASKSTGESESDSDEDNNPEVRVDEDEEDSQHPTSSNIEDEDEQQQDNEDDDERDYDEQEEEEEQDNSIAFLRAPKRETAPEDEEFEKELQKMMSESIEARRTEARQGPRVEMTVPMNLFRANVPKGRTEEDTSLAPPPDAPNSMAFKVFLKKGNKQTVRNIFVPLESTLAVNSKANQNAEREEQKQLKRLVLSYEQSQEDDDYAHARSAPTQTLSSTHTEGMKLKCPFAFLSYTRLEVDSVKHQQQYQHTTTGRGRGGGRGGRGGGHPHSQSQFQPQSQFQQQSQQPTGGAGGGRGNKGPVVIFSNSRGSVYKNR